MKFNAAAIQQHQAARLLTQNYRITRENILGDGLKLCRRAKAHNSSNPNNAQIAVHQHPNGKITSNMHDTALCGNAHLCAYCSITKASHLRDWINQLLIHAIKKAGLVLGLLTLTASHRRDSDWTQFNKNFFLALTDFGKTMRREFDAIGSLGRVRAFETPVGSNGLHGHIHDLFTYKPGADIEALQIVALAKWKAALKKHGLRCSKRGVDIKADGKFDPRYIAKEVAAHDTKKESKSDLVTLFELLDKSRRGDKQTGQDWIRAAKAIQGRDRWNVGQLASKLGIPSPSDWKHTEGVAKSEPAHIIEYSQTAHLMATETNSNRPGLAMILRTARQSIDNTIATQKIVTALCHDYTRQMLLASPLAEANAIKRSLDNIELLLKEGAINEALAEELTNRAIAEIRLHQSEKATELRKRVQAAICQPVALKPNEELVFV